MPGKPKRRARKYREMGNHDMADWIEKREEARISGVSLWKWEKENPKPSGDESKESIGIVSSRENEVNELRENEDVLKKKGEIYQLVSS